MIYKSKRNYSKNKQQNWSFYNNFLLKIGESKNKTHYNIPIVKCTYCVSAIKTTFCAELVTINFELITWCERVCTTVPIYDKIHQSKVASALKFKREKGGVKDAERELVLTPSVILYSIIHFENLSINIHILLIYAVKVNSCSGDARLLCGADRHDDDADDDDDAAAAAALLTGGGDPAGTSRFIDENLNLGFRSATAAVRCCLFSNSLCKLLPEPPALSF
ncbi:hypothetical protein AGLY_001092 [Aphis glycines]|uniref:Uncharacterized protein n=1 Tax=Aphis glycines TaxID=307491 RepID=A0A6G0UAB2_APHGL|nr:hypothetical protein AGLY_001092 [Aphis glycines]